MPPRTIFADWPCSIARLMELLGDPWTPLLVRDAFHGLRRFDDFQASLGIARNTLTDRLRRLVEAGVMEARMYQDSPPRQEYVLTQMGRELFPVLATMVAWGDRWLDGGEGAPTVLHHEPCGHDIRPELICVDCGEPLRSEDVSYRLGPGHTGPGTVGGDVRFNVGPPRRAH